MKHTKGTWYTGGSFNDQPQVSSEETGHTIALCYSLGQPDGHSLGKPDRDTTEAEANAKLIAAAPKLLEACWASVKSLGEVLGMTDGEVELLKMLQIAINEAEGR